ncbi:glycosyl hydrolase family 61-domain-containing protein [Pyrenochaeta sp. MPI-SDFR-AT-0127]|nr:glycosyl hydrolase family 61-domain-containing protein [Pyrenochaeta sp. MPI-SDFR-AT-0127]
MKFPATFSIIASLLATATAHGGVDSYTVGSTTFPGWSPYNSFTSQKTLQRQYSSYDPLYIKDLSSVNIRCNNAGALGTGVSGTVAAGEKLLARWKQWTHRPSAFFVYMAKCPSSGCNSWDGAGKVWFKIYHQGLISGTQNAGIWAGDAILDTLVATVTIPASLVAGEYLIRHEILALHQANNPQFYPECAQFVVTGSGTVSPPSSALVSFPGAYVGTEPGIAFNIDSPEAMKATTYPIPGPAVWDGTGNAPSPGTEPTPEPTPVPSVPPTTLATSATPKPTVPSCMPVKKYGQCGGKTFSGCTVCESGSTCSASGDYYSQCV